MNKMTLALALGTGLALGLGASARPALASPIQTITTQSLSASTFNSDFTAYNAPVVSAFRYQGATSDSGVIESQVFQGTGKYAGVYAYGYQILVNPTKDGGGEPVHVDSASFKFNATPLGTDLNNTGTTAYGYIVKNGQIGGLALAGDQMPSNLSWQAGDTSGVIRAQYVDPATQTSSLNAGNNSATFVLLSTQVPASTNPSVNIGGASATTTVPVVYSAAGGSIDPIPIPEPATALAWAGMVGAVAFVRRVRKNRAAHPVA